MFFSEVLFCVFQCFFSAKVCRLRVASLVTTRVGRSAWREGKPKIGIEIQNRNTYVQTNKKNQLFGPFLHFEFCLQEHQCRENETGCQLNASKNDAALFYIFFCIFLSTECIEKWCLTLCSSLPIFYCDYLECFAMSCKLSLFAHVYVHWDMMVNYFNMKMLMKMLLIIMMTTHHPLPWSLCAATLNPNKLPPSPW